MFVELSTEELAASERGRRAAELRREREAVFLASMGVGDWGPVEVRGD